MTIDLLSTRWCSDSFSQEKTSSESDHSRRYLILDFGLTSKRIEGKQSIMTWLMITLRPLDTAHSTTNNLPKKCSQACCIYSMIMIPTLVYNDLQNWWNQAEQMSDVQIGHMIRVHWGWTFTLRLNSHSDYYLIN